MLPPSTTRPGEAERAGSQGRIVHPIRGGTVMAINQQQALNEWNNNNQNNNRNNGNNNN
jgi:hypothetical protein